MVEKADVARWGGGASGGDGVSDARRAERRLEDLFGTARALATYGTLAPGRPNHQVVAPLGGEWTEGSIEGDLVPTGWGAQLGYPGFRPRAGETPWGCGC